MLTTEEIQHAGAYVELLRKSVHELSLPNNNRNRAAGSCLAIAQDHHHAIVLLLEERLFASAFSLVRVAFEAYVRGEWLALCASDLIIEGFLKGKEPPKIDCQLTELELIDSFNEKILSKVSLTAAVGSHEAGHHDPDPVTEFREFPAPVMGAATGLHADEAWRLLGQEWQQLPTA